MLDTRGGSWRRFIWNATAVNGAFCLRGYPGVNTRVRGAAVIQNYSFILSSYAQDWDSERHRNILRMLFETLLIKRSS